MNSQLLISKVVLKWNVILVIGLSLEVGGGVLNLVSNNIFSIFFIIWVFGTTLLILGVIFYLCKKYAIEIAKSKVEKL